MKKLSAFKFDLISLIDLDPVDECQIGSGLDLASCQIYLNQILKIRNLKSD